MGANLGHIPLAWTFLWRLRWISSVNWSKEKSSDRGWFAHSPLSGLHRVLGLLATLGLPTKNAKRPQAGMRSMVCPSAVRRTFELSPPMSSLNQ